MNIISIVIFNSYGKRLLFNAFLNIPWVIYVIFIVIHVIFIVISEMLWNDVINIVIFL